MHLPAATFRAESSSSTEASTHSSAMSLGVMALAAMLLSTLIWSMPTDTPAPPHGNSGNYYRMLLVMFAGVASAFILVRDPRSWTRAFPGPLLLMVFYATLAMISSTYIPEYAFYSLWKSLEVFIVVLATAAILSYPTGQGTASNAYKVTLAIMAMLVLLYAIEGIVLPKQAFISARGNLNFQLIGVIPIAAANTVAFLGGVTAFAMFARLFRPMPALSKWFCALLFLIALTVLVLAQSRTSFVGFCLAVVVYLWIDRRFALLFGLAGIVVLAGIYASFFDVFSQYVLRGQDPTLVRSFSGRAPGWEEAWVAFQEAPFFGHGFAAYARAEIRGMGGNTSLHGAVFEVMVGTGAVGLSVWGGAIIWTLLRLYRLPSTGLQWFKSKEGRSVQAEMVGLSALILLRSATSSDLAENADNLIVFLSLLIYVESVRRIASESKS